MRSRKFLLIFLLAVFLIVQVTPLVAMDRPEKPKIMAPTGTDPGADDDTGEEHPWQDNEGDDNGDELYGFGKGIDFVIGLVKSVFKKNPRPVEKTGSDLKGKSKSNTVPMGRRIFK